MRKITLEYPRSLNENEIYIDDVQEQTHVVAGSLFNKLVIAQPVSWGSDLYGFVIVKNLGYNLDGYGGAKLNTLIKQYIFVNDESINKEYHNEFYAFDSWQEAFLWLVSQKPTGVKQLMYTIGDSTTIICDTMSFGLGNDTGSSVIDNITGWEVDSQQNINKEFDESVTEDIQEDGRKWWNEMVDAMDNIFESMKEEPEETVEDRRIMDELIDGLSEQIREEEDRRIMEEIMDRFEEVREEKPEPISFEGAKKAAADKVYIPKDKRDTVSVRGTSTITNPYNTDQQEKCLANEKKQKDLERAKLELGILLDEMESLNNVEKAILKLLK